MTRSDLRRVGDRTVVEALACGCLFLLALLCLRLNAIVRNVMWWDDFAVPRQPALTYLGSYRPVMFVEYHLWETLAPGHFWNGLPKYLALCYALVAVLLLARFLRRLGTPRMVVVSSGLLVAAHPIVTDALFWSSLRGMGLGLVFVLLGVDRLWFGQSSRSRLLGFAFLTLGVLTYQWLLPVAGVLLLGAVGISWLRGEAVDRKRLLPIALSLVGAALILAGWTEATRAILENYDDRGWAPAPTLEEAVRRRYHGWFDNWVNVFMPPLAATAGYRRAWSLWKWVPSFWILLALTGAIVGGLRRARLLVAGLLPVGLSALASAFTLLLPFSTHSWRTSLAALIGLSVGLAALGSILWEQRWGRAVFALASAAFLVVAALATRADDERRASGYFDAVRLEQQRHGMDAAWHEAALGRAGDTFGGFTLTVGYTPMTRRDYTPYADAWVTHHFRRYIHSQSDGVSSR